MLSILCVRLAIKVKVGMPESFKVGWYPPKKTGSSHLKCRCAFHIYNQLSGILHKIVWRLFSKDFATPSLTDENTVFYTEDNAELERREIEQFKLRRRWESR